MVDTALGLGDADLTFPVFSITATSAILSYLTEIMEPFSAVGYVGARLAQNLPLHVVSGTGQTGDVCWGDADNALPLMDGVGYSGAWADSALWSPRDILVSAAAFVGEVGSLEQDLPSLSPSFHAYVEQLGLMTESWPSFEINATGYSDNHGTVNITLPQWLLSGNSYSGQMASLAESLSRMTITATGYVVGNALLDQEMPFFWIVASGHGGQTGYYSIPVLNIRKGAVTEWNLGFNSVAYFNGKTIATDGTKIYEIGGDTDNVATPAAEITSNIKTGNLDLANWNQVRLTDAYANVKADGDLMIQFELDESAVYDFDMTMHNLIDTHEEKVNLGKGMKARTYGISLYNVDGSRFRLNKLQFIGQKLD